MRQLRPFLWVLGAGAFLLVFALIAPDSGVYPVCPFFLLTDLYCPGCGAQRAMHALMNGHIGQAFTLNPLMVTGLLYFAAEGVISILRKNGSGLRQISTLRYTPHAVLFIVITFWILRNIPAEPFTFLAP